MTVLTRRSLLAGAAGLTAAGGLFGLGGLAHSAVSSAPGDEGALRVGYLPITDAAPLLMAPGSACWVGTTRTDRR